MARRRFPLFALLVFILSFLPGSAALADVWDPIRKIIKETTYEERIWENVSGVMDVISEGKDPHAPENLGSENSYTIEIGNGVKYKFVNLCSTSKTGPRCYVKAEVFATAPKDSGVPAKVRERQSSARIMADGVVLNILGTPKAVEVPIIVSGKASVFASSTDLGGAFGPSCIASASVWMTLGYRNAWDVDVILEEELEAISVVGSPFQNPDKQITLRAEVPVGKGIWDKTEFHIDLRAYLLVNAAAGGDTLGYSLTQGGAAAWAKIDPQVYIDPAWPDADKFVIIFKNDVCMGCGDSSPVLPLLLDD